MSSTRIPGRRLFIAAAAVAVLAGCAGQTVPPPAATGRLVPLAAHLADGEYQVLFEPYDSELNPAARKTIDRVAAAVRTSGTARVTITGKSDLTGSLAAKMRLSETRAERVRDALIATGAVPAEHIDMIRPEAPRQQEGPMAGNRVGLRNWIVDVSVN